MLRAWVFIFPDVEKKSFLGRGGIWQVPGTTAISLVVPSTWAFHIPFVRLILIVRPPQRASPRGGGGTPRINSDPAVLHRKAGMLRVLVGMFPCISHFRPLCEARLNNQEIQPNNMSWCLFSARDQGVLWPQNHNRFAQNPPKSTGNALSALKPSTLQTHDRNPKSSRALFLFEGRWTPAVFDYMDYPLVLWSIWNFFSSSATTKFRFRSYKFLSGQLGVIPQVRNGWSHYLQT